MFKKFAFLILTICFFSNSFCNEEQYSIEPFLKWLIYENPFGYTLFGDKPISVAAYCIDLSAEDICYLWGGPPASHPFKELWKRWEDSEYSKKLKNYLLFEEKSHHNKNIRFVYLINKRAFLSKVKEHLSLFYSILGNEITPESLLEKVSTSKQLYHSLNCNEGLYGILFGFSKESTLAFHRFFQLEEILSRHSGNFPKKTPFFYLPPSPGFKNIVEEYEDFKRRFSSFSETIPLSNFQLPRFAVLNEDPEKDALLKKYKKMHKELVRIYSSGNFLEITLNKLLE